MQQARRTKLSWQNLGNIAEFNAAIEENHETFSQDNLCTGKYVPNVSEEFLHVREVILFPVLSLYREIPTKCHCLLTAVCGGRTRIALS